MFGGYAFKLFGGKKKKKRFDYKAGNKQLMTEISELREKQPELFEGGEWAVPEQQMGLAFGAGNQSMNNSAFVYQAIQNIYAKKHYGQLQSLLKNMQKHYTQTMGGDAQVTSYLDNADA